MYACAFMNRRTFVVTITGLLSEFACSRVPPLANTRGSADALALAVLDAIAGRDRAQLEALALDEQEFRDHVWAELPAAKPERNLPFSYVWGDLHQKSQVGLASTLIEHAGQRYKLERVTFAGETRYPSYRVYRGATFVAVDATGTEVPLRVCGSMIEKGGAWKVFSYVVD